MSPVSRNRFYQSKGHSTSLYTMFWRWGDKENSGSSSTNSEKLKPAGFTMKKYYLVAGTNQIALDYAKSEGWERSDIIIVSKVEDFYGVREMEVYLLPQWYTRFPKILPFLRFLAERRAYVFEDE